MAVNGLIGLPRHGKSYSAVELFILKAAKQGRTIVTNIPLQPVFYEEYPDLDVHFIDLEEYKEATEQDWLDLPPGLYVLDELWKIWPAGLRANEIPTHQLKFIKEHGHKLDSQNRETDIILVTQALDDIASPIKNMVETTILCVKLTEVGLMNKFRREYYSGVVRGFSGAKTKLIKKDHSCTYDPNIYKYYKSHTLSADTDNVDGSGVMNATIFGSLGFKIGVVVIVLLVIGIYFGVGSVSDDLKILTTAKEDLPQEMVPRSSLNNMVSRTSFNTTDDQFNHSFSEPQESPTFRLVGLFTDKTRIKYALITDGKFSRRIDPMLCKNKLQVVCVYKNQIVSHFTGLEGFEDLGKGKVQSVAGKQINKGIGRPSNASF